ncbi:MAG: bifunctional riboflavin kinase/FAD synthetase [Muribaculaceae bacterium]|nr:bifunctional riboflavin kinase/FAD synthetase [Muribaculaceae bacterium]
MKILDGNDFLMSNQEQLTATIGMFDGMHRGHITLINALKHEAMARHQRSAVITFRKHPQLVVNPGDSPKALMTLDKKIEAIAATAPDYLILLDFDKNLSQLSAKDFIELLHDHYNVATLVMGYNHRFGHERNTTFAHYVEQGRLADVEVVKAPEYLGRYAPVSSSIVRQLITSGRVEDAMNCMGHPFELSGKVVHGFHNGRGIGFPTANVGEIDPAMILPHQGAYAVMVYVSGQWHKGMVNIGHRPTLDNGDNVSIEVHIFDFDDDIYSQPITLHFVRFLRLEFKLGSIEQLRAQLTYDKQLSNQILDNYISQQSTIE